MSGTKKEPKPKLLSPDIFWWGGGLPREGMGAKKFGMSLETQGIKLFWRDVPGCCRDIPEAPEKFGKKMFGFNFWPLQWLPNLSSVATSSSIFYRIIRAGIGVFSLFGLTKVMFVPKTSDTTAPSLHPTPERKVKKTKKLRHYFALFRLKICYCSWPPNPVNGETQ